MHYKVVRQFGPLDGSAWTNYVDWSKLSQITDFCSLDNVLNDSAFRPTTQEDWDNCVNEDFKTDLITSLDYALKVQKGFPHSLILGVVMDPRESPSSEDHDHLLGYDIIDGHFDISLLTNCGGFPDVFANGLINQFGLITNIGKAYEVRDNLRAKHPDDAHACGCEVWGVYRVAP